jgi:hypothetical protein
MVQKVIITNQSVLEQLYGQKYETRVIPEINKLIAADKQIRGLETKLVYVDQLNESEYKVSKVSDPADEKQNKAAIDAICKKYNPYYMLILGGPDVIPHQTLIDPMKDLIDIIKANYKHYPEDPSFINSDLPYASSLPYSTKIIDYVPVLDRAVGRIGFSDNNPELLVAALDTVIHSKPKKKEAYEDYFAFASKFVSIGLSKIVLADKIVGSIIGKIFPKVSYELSPPYIWEDWNKKQVGALTHLFLCHGYPYYPYLLGQGDNETYKVAISEESIADQLKSGTVVVSSACYAAQLYAKEAYFTSWNFLTDITSEIPDQRNPHAVRSGICEAYLKNGAAAFVGSTFWGGDIRIGSSFLQNMLEGLSTGQALLKARHDFIVNAGDKFDEEMQATLAGFLLLGDPSIQPVETKLSHVEHSKQKHEALTAGAQKIAQSFKVPELTVLTKIQRQTLEKRLKLYLGIK